MSESDTSIPAVPAVPSPPAAPVAPSTNGITTSNDVPGTPAPAPETTDTSSTVSVPATSSIKAIVASHADDDAETDPEAADGTSDAPDDDEPAEPQVVNTATGQYVSMPDGTEVQTRSHPYPISNGEWAKYEKTHAGDQARYPYVPGDKEYSAHSDPHIPNSSLAQKIEAEIASYAERVLTNPSAAVSNIWNSVRGIFDGELEKFTETGVGGGKIVE